MPNSVQRLGDEAFWGCSSLQSATIGDGVTEIRKWAFSGCVSLSEFKCGENVAIIGDEAFRDCTALVKFVSESETQTVCGERDISDINIEDIS